MKRTFCTSPFPKVLPSTVALPLPFSIPPNLKGIRLPGPCVHDPAEQHPFSPVDSHLGPHVKVDVEVSFRGRPTLYSNTSSTLFNSAESERKFVCLADACAA